EMANGAASSPTVARPALSRATMARRVGSASAAKMRSRAGKRPVHELTDLLNMFRLRLSIGALRRRRGGMEQHRVVSGEERLTARAELLAKEKEFTRLRDELSQLRRALPWQRVDKPYQFEGPAGMATLADLFDGRSQLIVQHFMFDPGWDAGCKSCSF